MTWKEIAPEMVRSEIKKAERAIVLYGLDGCSACSRVYDALSTVEFSKIEVVPIATTFLEFKPAHSAIMEAEHLTTFPHVRLFFNNALIGAWETVSHDATAEEIATFTRRWMARSVFRRFGITERKQN